MADFQANCLANRLANRLATVWLIVWPTVWPKAKRLFGWFTSTCLFEQEVCSLVEDLGKTDPERAFRTYVQWYLRQECMNQEGLVSAAPAFFVPLFLSP